MSYQCQNLRRRKIKITENKAEFEVPALSVTHLVLDGESEAPVQSQGTKIPWAAILIVIAVIAVGCASFHFGFRKGR